MAEPRPVQLCLVRHAPPLVAAGTCYGRLDVPAEHTATLACAQRLARALPGPSLVWHSPLQRCAQLAQAVQAARPDWQRPQADDRLREMDFGTWEGQAWSNLGKPAIDAWTADFAHHRPGGGEALVDMLARVAQALQATRQAMRDAGLAQGVWLTHAGVARCVDWLLRPGAQSTTPRVDQWPRHAPAWGEWDTVTLPPAGFGQNPTATR